MIVPLDHGVHDGPILGLIDIRATLRAISGVCDAVVVHKGMARIVQEEAPRTPFLLHLSASTTRGEVLRKVLVSNPVEARKLGASGVSVHVNMGNVHEPEMLRDLGQTVCAAQDLGLPVLAMMYVRSKSKRGFVNHTDLDSIKHAVRVAAELGADVIKTPYTGAKETFAEAIRGIPVPVVIAGGLPASNTDQILEVIKDAVAAGAAGVSMGRYVFQHPDVEWMAEAIRDIVHFPRGEESVCARLTQILERK